MAGMPVFSREGALSLSLSLPTSMNSSPLHTKTETRTKLPNSQTQTQTPGRILEEKFRASPEAIDPRVDSTTETDSP